MKFKKLIKTIAAIFIASLSLVLIFAVSPIVNAEDSDNQAKLVVSSTNSNDKIYVNKTELGSYGAYIPDNNGNIYITLSLSKQVSGSVKVTFHTEDRTAVSEAGDYYFTGSTATAYSSKSQKAKVTHEETTITLNEQNNYTYGINYKTSKTAIATTKNSLIYTPYFILVIDEVTNASEPDTTKYPCSLAYSRILGLSTNIYGSYYTMNGLSYSVNVSTEEFDKDYEYGSERGYYYRSGNLMYKNSSYTSSEVIDAMINSDIAKLYVQTYIDVDTTGFIANMNCFKSWLYGGNNVIESNKISFYYDDWFNHNDGYFGDEYNQGHYDNYIYFDKYTDKFIMRFYNESGINRWANATLTTKIIDNTKQELLGEYIDYSSMSKDGTIRLALRFSEPVQVYGNEKLTITTFIKNKSYSIKFRYVEGSLTNTLYFEATLGTGDLESENSLIEALTLDTLSNINMISDLGLNYYNKQNFYAKGEYDDIFITNSKKHEVSVEIDLRNPSVEFVNSAGSNKILNSRNITLDINNVIAGRIYYSWLDHSTKNTVTETNYQYFIDINENIDTENRDYHRVSIPSNNGLNGEYYLHIYIVTIYGKTKEMIIQCQDGLNVQKGAFKFDCIDPNFTVANVYNSLTAKTFKLNFEMLTDSFESDYSSIYMSISNQDKTVIKNVLLYQKDISSKLNINNNVYVVKSTVEFNYLDTQSSPSKESYNVKSLCFSSKEKALEYLRFYEYQDLELVQITTTSGITKAAGETMQMATGQYWIRYKKSNFDTTQSGVHDNSEWVYYFYAESGASVDGIDIENLSTINSNLSNAINTVVNKIVSNGNGYEYDLLSVKADTKDQNGYTPSTSNYKTFEEEAILTTLKRPSSISKFKANVKYSDNDFELTSRGGIGTASLTLNDLTTLGIGLQENSYQYFLIGFYASDEAGNSTYNDIEYVSYKFDNRTMFDSSLTNYVNTDSIHVYNLEGNSSKQLTFSTTLQGTMSISYMIFRGEQIADLTKLNSYSDYFTFTQDSNNSLKLTVNKLGTGYYEIELLFKENEQDAGKISQTYSFYVTNKYEDNTINYNTIKTTGVLTNKVYQLGTDYYYMYNTANGSIVKQVSYGTNLLELDSTLSLSNKPASFSSKDEARKYVLLMEYKDFSLVYLENNEKGQYIAQMLNEGMDPAYKRADKEEQQAMVGQTWIRYKRSSWSTKSTSTDWVYYFYSTTKQTSVSVNELLYNNTVLSNAVNTVADYIIGLGSTVYLIGDEYTDDFGSPYLEKTQVHYQEEPFNKNFNNEPLNGITYGGDVNVYKNNITNISGLDTVPLAGSTKLSVSKYTILYYAKYYTGADINALTYTKMNVKNGSRFVDGIEEDASGVYAIKEYTDNGARIYLLYIDSVAPSLNISYVQATSKVDKSVSLTSVVNGTKYSCKSFNFNVTASNASKELDSLAFVGVYSYKNKELLNTYYFKDLVNNNISLANGEYILLVSDRSGNSYKFTVFINDTDMITKIEVVNNSYVLVSCNREVSQIYRYEVYLNNNPIPIDTEYTGTTKKYKDGGMYRIYIEDIYGFVREENGSGGGLVFERELPNLNSVIISYLNNDSGYTKYEKNKTRYLEVAESLGGKFYVSSSRRLRFTFDNQDFAYEVIGLESGDYSENTMFHYLTINTNKNYTVRVFYNEYPDVEAFFIVQMDFEAPVIQATYSKINYLKAEEIENNSNYLTNLAKTATVDQIFVPTSIAYIQGLTEINNISNNGIVDTNVITLKVTDESEIESLIITIDGNEYANYQKGDIPALVYLSRYGEYKVIATDIFQNESTKTFTNQKQDHLEYTIDGNVVALDGDPITYGNNSIVFKFTKNCSFAVKLTDKNNNSYVLMYEIKDGVVTEQYYICKSYVENNVVKKEYQLVNRTQNITDPVTGNLEEIDNPIFSKTDIAIKINKYYEIEDLADAYGNEINFVNMSLMYDKNGSIYIKFTYGEDNVEIASRTIFDGKEPYAFDTKLSHDINTVSITNGDTKKELNEDKIYFVNYSFSIVDLDSTQNLITKIEISYSKTDAFKDYTLIYPIQTKNKYDEIVNTILVFNDLNNENSFNTTENGFYSIKIYNAYGNVNEVVINRSDKFDVVTKAVFKGNQSVNYDATIGTTKVIKSNDQVLITAYGSLVTFTVGKMNSLSNYESYTSFDLEGNKSPYILTLKEEGSYKVTCVDDFGNVEERLVEIKNTSLTEDSSNPILVGFNQKARLKDQGYTNTLISIVNDQITELGIKYIAIKKPGKTEYTIIFDEISQTEVSYNAEELVNIIGNDGNGKYEIVFKDEFGSSLTKYVNYSGETTLKIYRRTRTSSNDEEINISSIIDNTIWSNYSVIFTTTSIDYIYKKDGDISQIDSPIQLSLSSNGSLTKTIYYIDEYGYEYSFTVNLLKRDVKVDLNSNIHYEIVNGIKTTKKNVAVNYTNDTTCTYTINGEGPYVYDNQKTLYKDGLYVFIVEDKAGNICRTQIKKDSIVEYQFLDVNDDRILVNGDVTNNTGIKFKVINSDSSYISAVYLNGTKLTDTAQTTFNQPGHYNIILKDEAGNKDYFEFYIITHAITGLQYQTPNTYIITEMWYGIGDGNTQNFMNSGMIQLNESKNYSILDANENGQYTVVMTSSVYSNVITFSFEVNNNAPEISLVGCKEGEKTIEDITVTGYSKGDTISVYRDGKLIQQNTISSSSDVPTITEGGEYKIVVTNIQGVSTTLEFEHIKILNTAGSVLIIVALFAASVGIITGVVLRNKQKFDE